MRWRRAVTAGMAIALMSGGVASAATPESSVSTRLQDRREIASGTRAYAEGFQDGRFYANGWHIAGEMGGVWTPPLKLLDGVWFGVDGQWIGPATKFSSGYGYTRFTLPDTAGLHLQRTDFVPDGVRGALFGLRITNPGARRTVTVMVDAHSELTTAWPWGTDPNRNPPDQSSNVPDHGSFVDRSLAFTDDGTFGAGAPEHHYAALVGARRAPASHDVDDTGGTFRGDQGDAGCTGKEPAPGKMPSECSDGPFGKGTGGQLTYRLRVPAQGSRTLWIAAAGSDQGRTNGDLSFARVQLDAALRNPNGELRRKVASRARLARRTRVSLPGDRLLQHAIAWGKQNLADLTQTATNLQIRWTNQGKEPFAPVLGTVPSVTFFGAGFPDYPWLFATDGEYTDFAAMALGQFKTAEDHLRALRDVSEILNHRSGVVVHEAVTDGSIYFGHDSVTVKPDGTRTNDFNTDETIKFPSAVALVWRWTGDNAFMRSMYGFAKRNLEYVQKNLTGVFDGWPSGSGNVERSGMGPLKLDNAVYYIRALYDLADMARARGDTATANWASGIAAKLRGEFEKDWWDPKAGQYADSLNADGSQNFQEHWIGEVPQEAELVRGVRTGPGLASHEHGTAALAARETPCYSGDRPGNQGLYHTGCTGGPDQKSPDFEIFSLTTSIQAVGEGNYGRLGPDQQRRYTNANAETMFSEPKTGGTPDEQPGAMPEIFPSTPSVAPPDKAIAPNIDKCFTCRSMFMQAWGNYGTAWSVVHQQLGVRPFINAGRLEVVPQVPPGQPRVAGRNIRLGGGHADVLASHAGARYRTVVAVHGVHLTTLRIGATLPRGTTPAHVRLDGRAVRYRVRETNRGAEVTARARGGGIHTITVVAG